MIKMSCFIFLSNTLFYVFFKMRGGINVSTEQNAMLCLVVHIVSYTLPYFLRLSPTLSLSVSFVC